MAALGDDITDQALLLALLAGGQRMAQLLRAKVGDYDEEHHALRLWDGKGKRPTPREHLLPLAPRAAARVTELVKRAKAKESSWLFSTHGKVAFWPRKPPASEWWPFALQWVVSRSICATSAALPKPC